MEHHLPDTENPRYEALSVEAASVVEQPSAWARVRRNGAVRRANIFSLTNRPQNLQQQEAPHGRNPFPQFLRRR